LPAAGGCRISVSLDELKTILIGLSAGERAELACCLLEILEPAEAGMADAWRVEIARRVAEIRSGLAVGLPIDGVLAELRERYS